MRILVTGSCGYKGSVLVPLLLSKGHSIISIDTEWFGNRLENHPNLVHYKSDFRNVDPNVFEGASTVIHLANIANDPAVELNPSLSWEVNVLGSKIIADMASKASVAHFIYASSGSVYGIKSEERVTEDLDLIPISTYNKTKMIAERIFLSYKDEYKVHCVRPATVCGLSPRMRLDVAVNNLTYQALSKGTITILGGSQTRPNIHVEDIAQLYNHLAINHSTIASGCYNAGFENLSITEIAKLISTKIDCELNFLQSNDPRSYRQDSSKVLATGFTQKNTVSKAIDEIIAAYRRKDLIVDDTCYNVKWMKQLSIK